MAMFKTISFKVSALFILIIVILAFVLFFDNIYAISIVRTQVAQSYMKTLPSIVSKVDDSLDEVRSYLIRTSNPTEGNIDFMMFNMSEKGSPDYYYSTSAIFQKFNQDINCFSMEVNTLFLYSQGNDEIISFTVANSESKDYNKRKMELKNIVFSKLNKVMNSRWQVCSLSGKPGLICIVSDSAGSYVGAWVDIHQLMTPDYVLENEGKSASIIMTRDNEIILSSKKDIPIDEIIKSDVIKQESGYQALDISGGEISYLVIVQELNSAEILFVKAIDENVMLKDLSFFNKMIIFIPLGVVFILFIYFSLIRKILLKPINELVNGMKSISQGNLDIKLKEQKSIDFIFVAQTFNNMVSQIHNLKIDIYEEKLKAKNSELEIKRAELQNLQLQINPHFFSNSLNIIYNLAAVNDNKTVQKMALYLAKYFRYLMQAGLTLLELRSEIDFVRNYLEIQKLRFTKKLCFDISVPEKYMSYKLPALLVQPLVENSIIHGFTDSKETLVIKITAQEDPEDPERFFIIQIQDNGIGFIQEDISKYICLDYLGENAENHIGVLNVKNRLKMVSGDEAKINIFNNKDGGATVRLYLPINSVNL